MPAGPVIHAFTCEMTSVDGATARDAGKFDHCRFKEKNIVLVRHIRGGRSGFVALWRQGERIFSCGIPEKSFAQPAARTVTKSGRCGGSMLGPLVLSCVR
jgi:hypothetical protein